MNSAGPVAVELREPAKRAEAAGSCPADSPANRLPNLLAVLRRHQQTLEQDAAAFDPHTHLVQKN